MTENKHKRKSVNVRAIVTMPPYAPYIMEVLRHPIVSGIRLNTVMPLKESHESALKRIHEKALKYKKDFWIDLKCRQLRVADYGVPPFSAITLSHEIDVYTPTKAYFSDRCESATILGVDGKRLIMQDGPSRVVGPGESVTIPHPTLNIKGYLTDTDKKYIEACNSVGINKYMLSFVEHLGDSSELKKYSPDPEIVEKIESQKGLGYIEHNWSGNRLMAARGDLFMELHYPHNIVNALENILETDENAICASRILSSMAKSPEPSCEEIGDLDNLLRMGYRTFMFGDEVCLNRDPIIGALNVFSEISRRYEK